MKINEFLSEHDEHRMPRDFGPWIAFDDFDPPWRIGDLRSMGRRNIIELDEENQRYRITRKALRFIADTKFRDAGGQSPALRTDDQPHSL